jgi:CxxC motif-containing protein
VDVEWTQEGGVTGIRNHLCKLANEYVSSELFDPRRTVTTSMPVDGGDWPLVSVRTNPPIPKDRMLEAMDEITGVRVQAPIHVGDVLIANILNTGCDVIATRNVKIA